MVPEFLRVADYIERAVNIARRIDTETKASMAKPKLDEFRAAVIKDTELANLKEEVSQWVKQYPVPGDL